MKSLLIVFPIVFLTLFIYLGQALWIYLDGKRSGYSYAFLWAILALVSFPVPLIIYLIISRHEKKKCSNCGKFIDKSLKCCPYCGENNKKLCPHCDYSIESDWNFCPNCSRALK